MIRNSLLLLFIFLFIGFTNAQDISLDFANSIGTSRWDAPTDIAVDQVGNVYTTGVFSDVVDFDPGPGVMNLSSVGTSDTGPYGGVNGYVKKMDANGNLVWAINNLAGDLSSTSSAYGINQIAVDPSGNIFVLAVANDSIDLDPSANVLNLNHSGSFKVLQKFDPNGSLIWALHLAAGSLIKTDANGDIFISGVFLLGTIDIDPGPGVYNISNYINANCPFLYKLNGSTGNLIWGANFEYACNGSKVNDMAVAPNGNVMIGGHYINTIDPSPNSNSYLLSGQNNSNQNGFVIMLDNAGNFIHAFNYAAPGDSNAYQVEYDAYNIAYVLVAGLIHPSDTETRSGIIKYNVNSGISASEVTTIPSGYQHHIDMEVSSEGDIYLTGRFDGTADLDPDDNTSFNISSSSYSSYITKWNAGNNYLSPPTFAWGFNMDYDFEFNGQRLYMASGSGDDLYLTAAFEDTLDADYDTGIYNLYSPTCSLGYCTNIATQKINTCPGSSDETIQVDLCLGESYTFPDGSIVNNIVSDTIDTYTFTHPNGCDSIIVTEITIHPNFTNNQTIYHCIGSSYTFPDGTTQNITAPFTQTSNLISINGCDSTIITNVIIDTPISASTSYDCQSNEAIVMITDLGTLNSSPTPPFDMMVNGVVTNISSPGTYTFTQLATDQSHRVHLFSNNCAPDLYIYPDCYEAPCDPNAIEKILNGSFETSSSAWNETATFMDGVTDTGYGLINNQKAYNSIFSAWLGGFNQGSINTLKQYVTLPESVGITELSWWENEYGGCANDDIFTISIDGNIIYTRTSYNNPYCGDGNWHLKTLDISAYANGFSHLLSFDYTQPGTNGYTNLFLDKISVSSCPCSNYNVVNDQICNGTDYTFPNGTSQSNITSNVTQYSFLTNSLGCDSTIVTTLTINPIDSTFSTIDICYGDDYTFPDGTIQTNITTNVTQHSLLTNSVGCDSIIVTELIRNYGSGFPFATASYVCEGDDYTYADGTISTNLTADESHLSVIPNQYGCDSSIIENVNVQSYYNLEGNTWICEYQVYQKHIYVDDTATGNNDGTSWNNAFTDLQDALALAATETFYDIHVAEGIYYPTPGTQRGIAFELPERTTLLGGYPNNGGTRDPAANETILSGNVDGVPSKDGNSYHVVLIKDVQLVTMDGFTIRDGNADQVNSFGRSRGGGIYSKGSSSIVFENCDVKWNRAIYGGGMFLTLSPVVQVNRTEIKNNRADYGAAIFHSNETRLYLEGTRITNNIANIRAAIEVNNSLYTRLINTIIANNITANSNAISFVATNRDQSCDIYNSTITGEEKNKNLISMLIGFGDQLDINIYNSIIAHQDANFDKTFIAYQNGILNLNTDHCYLTGTSVLGTSNGNLYTGTDGALVLNNDYSLPSNSLGIDAGDDALVQYYSTDINGADRILGSAVDMGAFEYSATSSRETLDNDIDNAPTFSAKVYPNPASDELNIHIEGKEEASVQTDLYNVNGQLLQSKEQEVTSNEVLKMDVSSLPSGIYFLHIKVDDSIHTERVIIQD